jgi:hypothetical protein
MSNFDNLNSLMTGHNPHKELLKQTRKLVSKWEPTGLLDEIDDSTKKQGMAVLLENQATQLIKEASATGTGGNKEEWSGVALPLVRRIFGELSAQEFVSVQPMNLPSGLIFFLDFKYGSAGQANHTADTDVFGNTSGSGDASGGLYGAGKFGYSINDKAITAVEVNADGSGNAVTASATWKEVEFEPDLSASVAAGTLKKLQIGAGEFTRPDFNGVRAFELSGSGITATYPAYTVVDDVNNVTTASFFFEITDVLDQKLGVKYHEAPVATDRGDFEATTTQIDANPETDIDIPEVDISLKSEAIVAKTRKLKAVWTPELAQDLNAYHSVDAEAELTSLLSEYVSMEIDLEILEMLHLNANAKTEKWSARVGHEYNSVTKLFAETSGASNAYTKGDWFQTLGNKIQSVSNAIHQKTLRGGANFIVVSPEVATILESIPGYATSSDGDSTSKSYAMGVQKAGLLNNRYTVYKNPYQFENVILVGFRGSNFLETGAVYAPYVPLIMTPLVYDPKNFTPRKGVMTRYAKKIVRPEFYGKVIVADVNFV